MNGDDIPQSFQKGEAFEEYLRNRIFTKSQYSIVEKTHGFHENNGDYIESTLHPDFKLRDLTNDREFYLEANTDLYLSIVNKFKIGLDAPLSSQLLWNRYNPKLRKAG